MADFLVRPELVRELYKRINELKRHNEALERELSQARVKQDVISEECADALEAASLKQAHDKMYIRLLEAEKWQSRYRAQEYVVSDLQSQLAYLQAECSELRERLARGE